MNRRGRKGENQALPHKTHNFCILPYMRAMKHSAEEQRVVTELLTRMRASMTSLQICKLVSLVTSRNRSRVVFLICRSVTGKASNESEHPQPCHVATLQCKNAMKGFHLPIHKAVSVRAVWCPWSSLPELYNVTKVEMEL